MIAFQAWNGLERDGDRRPGDHRGAREGPPAAPGAQGPGAADRGLPRQGRRAADQEGQGRTGGDPRLQRRARHADPGGRYEVFRKELRSWSVPFQVWLPLASYFNQGIAFHEYPDVPPYPASHGCVRVPVPEAHEVYDFAAIGTAVLVY